jgi:protocatechuate 3,4-dioxygenase beta subunit
MTTRITRRKAIAGLGSVTLGSLLAACGGDDSRTAATTTDVTTTEGGTTTVQPRTDTGSAASLFDETSACTLTAEQTEGPYYFDADAIRSDITEDRDGTPLRLAIRVREAGECTPLRNAVVDIWHCDAGGVYSGFESADDERFLRGPQVTDREGIAEFRTIYPGWYQGRTVHIHAKVHLDRRTVLTTQIYFDDAVSDRVFASTPYADRGDRDQRNESDGIFDASLVLPTLDRDGDGYVGAISFDVQRA